MLSRHNPAFSSLVISQARSLTASRTITTLAYARLYDGTVAADYYRAMDQVEARMALVDGTEDAPPTGGQLLALVDALHDGTLNEDQRETVHALRLGILALAELTPAHCGG